MFFMLKKEKIYCAYISKCNSNREKQGILLLILKREKHKARLQSPQDIGIILHIKKFIGIIKRNNIKK